MNQATKLGLLELARQLGNVQAQKSSEFFVICASRTSFFEPLIRVIYMFDNIWNYRYIPV